MDSNNKPFLEVVSSWKRDANFRTQFTRFDLLYFAIIFLKSRKLRSVICTTLPTLRVTAYDYEKRHFITVHLELCPLLLFQNYGIVRQSKKPQEF